MKFLQKVDLITLFIIKVSLTAFRNNSPKSDVNESVFTCYKRHKNYTITRSYNTMQQKNNCLTQ